MNYSSKPNGFDNIVFTDLICWSAFIFHFVTLILFVDYYQVFKLKSFYTLHQHKWHVGLYKLICEGHKDYTTLAIRDTACKTCIDITWTVKFDIKTNPEKNIICSIKDLIKSNFDHPKDKGEKNSRDWTGLIDLDKIYYRLRLDF